MQAGWAWTAIQALGTDREAQDKASIKAGDPGYVDLKHVGAAQAMLVRIMCVQYGTALCCASRALWLVQQELCAQCRSCGCVLVGIISSVAHVAAVLRHG